MQHQNIQERAITELLEKFSKGFYFSKAYEIAAHAHKEQKRKDGKPYMTHVNAVIINTYLCLKEHHESWPDDLMDIYLSVAALHDVVEDHGDIWPLHKIEEELNSLKLTSWPVTHITLAVTAISKLPKGTEPYHHYVIRVKYNELSRVVKLADLRHNMSDLTPGNMLDKYQLTKYVLEN